MGGKARKVQRKRSGVRATTWEEQNEKNSTRIATQEEQQCKKNVST
jgi:hypothetical protein